MKTTHILRQIFKDRIIVIDPRSMAGGTIEYFSNGDFYLNIGGVDRLMYLFAKCGEEVRRIKLNFDYIDDHLRSEINEKIIKKYAKQLTEIQIVAVNFLSCWNEVSAGGIQFSNVTKFVYTGNNFTNSLDLNDVFPTLRSFNLRSDSNSFGGYVDMRFNPNCLKNIENLHELKLQIGAKSLKKCELESIFRKNNQISKLQFTMTGKTDILRFIEINLQNLKSICIESESQQFLKNHLKLFKKNVFAMPKLKELYLSGPYEDNMLFDFINSFKNLEMVNTAQPSVNEFFKSIGKLRYVKEFVTICSYLWPIPLREIFRTVDKATSNLNTLKVISRR